MQRMWRQLFAAVLGVVALSGVASAQNPAPAASYRMEVPQAMPAPAPAKAVANQITPVSGAIYVRGSGGCSSCGTAAAAPAASTHGAFAQYGPRDRNGCGSLCADTKFVFGSCKSFFDPCGSASCGRAGCGRAGCGGCASCPSWPLAQPFGTKFQGCVYDTYLNH
ncbi:MAG: hypothetical protein C0467_18110 [Planctomycetaceae bacterium]|nr:hypothetical protein [Planctomycetaceae bacterium]